VSDVEIRSATAADDDALRALDEATWSPVTTPAAPRAPDASSYALSTTEPVLVAVDGDEVVGYVKLGRPTPLESNRHVLEVKGLAVDPARHGRGIGRRLMAAAAETAAARGARRLTLRVLAGNDGARRLYEACGYATEGVLRGEFLLDGEYVDDVLMALDLTAADDRAAGTL
jgi:ribosomal protein S18 acetylase RimI-like enzyme